MKYHPNERDNGNIEAAVITAKCSKGKQTYGIRIQKMEDGDWWRTWAFPIDEKRASKESYDATKAQGNLYVTEGYPGCPYCGTKGFVQCGSCHKLSCWNGESRLVCPWCGSEMKEIVSAKEKFDVSGGDI